MVLQFMCQKDNGDEPDRETIRDGTSTKQNGYQKAPNKAESEKSFGKRKKASKDDKGMHEPFEWYDKCNKRNRNKGKGKLLVMCEGVRTEHDLQLLPDDFWTF